jgi:hypothetical protein
MWRYALFGWIGLVAVSASAASANDSADHLFPERGHDFAAVPRGAQLLHRFAWTNGERARLEIVDVRASCTCVTVHTKPRALEPGQTGIVEVLVDGRKFVGQKTFVVHLTMQNERQRIVTLQVSAHVRPDVVYNPGQVNFGIVPVGGSAKQTVELEYAGSLDWRITELAQAHPHLDVTLEEMYRKPGAAGYRIHVALRTDCPPGDLKAELLFKTNDTNLPVTPLLVEAVVRPVITAAPSPLSFGLVHAGQTSTRRIAVRGEKPFRITKVEGGGEGLDVSVSGNSPNVQFVTVAWQAGSAGELQRTLVIHTDCPQQPTVTIPLHGQATP